MRTFVRVAVVVEDVVQRVIVVVLRLLGRHRPLVNPFVAHGTTHRARVGARVDLGRSAAAPPAEPTPGARSRWKVLRASAARFLTLELPDVPVIVRTPNGSSKVMADREGYVDAEVELPGLEPGWHELGLALEGGDGSVVPAKLLVVDPAARVGLISDVDDTILETGLTRGLAVVKATLFTDVADRAPLPGAAALYRELLRDGDGVERPVFYVSTSPWNLHEMLMQFLVLRGFPLGPLLLTDWGPSHSGLFRLGAQDHKLRLVRRVLADHPGLQLVLVGDSGQLDPEIYATLAREAPDRIRAVYIRRTKGRTAARDAEVDALAAEVTAAGVPMVAVDDSVQIAEHAAGLGLLDGGAVEAVRQACRELP